MNTNTGHNPEDGCGLLALTGAFVVALVLLVFLAFGPVAAALVITIILAIIILGLVYA